MSKTIENRKDIAIFVAQQNGLNREQKIHFFLIGNLILKWHNISNLQAKNYI